MTYPNQPLDSQQVVIGSPYVPDNGFIPMQGSTNIDTDAQNNQSTPINLNISQVNSLPITMAGNDGVTSTALLQIANGLYNGSTTDQERGNLDGITLINASSVSVGVVSTIQTNYNHRQAIIVLDVISVGSPTASVTLTINGIEPVTGYTWPILAGTAVTTVTQKIYRISPYLAAVTNVTAADMLPRSWQVVVTANNSNPATYLVGAILLV